MNIVRGLNMALSFVLEMGMLAAFAYWGFTAGTPGWIAALLGIGMPVVVIVIWGAFMAPKASRPLQEPWHTVVEMILFGLAVLAIAASGHLSLALVFAALAVINQIVKHAWRT